MVITAAYVAAVISVEIWFALRDPLTGAILHGLLALLIFGQSLLSRDPAQRQVLSALLLLPLLRLFSLMMPLRNIHQIYWYALTGAPLLLAVLLTAWQYGLTWSDFGLTMANWRFQSLIIASSLPLSFVGFWLSHPKPLVATFNWPKIFVAALVLSVFMGVTEELLFRGLLSRVLTEIYGNAGLWWSALLFAGMHIGVLSLGYVLLMGGVGLLFGWSVQRTRSLWGVIIGHSLFSSFMLLIWPLLWR